MEIRIGSVKSFREQFEAAARLCNPRSPKPVLGSVLLMAGADGVTLGATDLETWALVVVEGVEVIRGGWALLPAERVRAILSKIDATEGVTIASDGPSVEIRSGRSKSTLQTEDASIFPTIEIPRPTDGLRVAASDLKRLIGQSVFIPDEDANTKFALGGCVFERELLGLVVVSTDGRRLARATTLIDPMGESEAITPNIPAKALKLVRTALAALNDDAPVSFGADARRAVFDLGSCRFACRLIEGRFPRYRDIFPDTCNGKATAKAGPFKASVDLAASVSGEESRGLRFSFRAGEPLWVRAATADVGESEVQLDIEYAGPDIEVILDGRMLIQGLGAVDAGAEVTVSLVDPKQPVVFTAAGFDYLLMPMSK